MSRALEDFGAAKGETETQHRCAGSGSSEDSRGHLEGDRRKQQGQLVWTGLDGESQFFFIALCCEARSALCRVHGVSP